MLLQIMCFASMAKLKATQVSASVHTDRCCAEVLPLLASADGSSDGADEVLGITIAVTVLVRAPHTCRNKYGATLHSGGLARRWCGEYKR